MLTQACLRVSFAQSVCLGGPNETKHPHRMQYAMGDECLNALLLVNELTS